MNPVTEAITKVKGMTAIEWAHYTGGPWLVCTEVSPGCAKCYARELMESRLGHLVRKAYQKAGFQDWETRPIWGKNAPRVKTKGFWQDAYACDRDAAKKGVRYRMFPSLIDWLDDMPAGIIDQDGKWLEPIAVLADFLKVVHDTPNLDWLLLTKRPENWRTRLKAAGEFVAQRRASGDAGLVMFIVTWLDGDAPTNVWLGASVEDQKRADERIPELLKIPAKVRFLSVEPMLGPVEFSDVTSRSDAVSQLGKKSLDGIHWVIFGGESGAKARVCNVDWIRSGVQQCRAAGIAPFVKQMGSNMDLFETKYDALNEPLYQLVSGYPDEHQVLFKDKKGGDMSEWPEDLRIRDFPCPA